MADNTRTDHTVAPTHRTKPAFSMFIEDAGFVFSLLFAQNTDKHWGIFGKIMVDNAAYRAHNNGITYCVALGNVQRTGRTKMKTTKKTNTAKKFKMVVPRPYGFELACRLQDEFSLRMRLEVDCEDTQSCVASVNAIHNEDTLEEMSQYSNGFLAALDAVMTQTIRLSDIREVERNA
jgi:hypothetical protein